MLTLTSPVSLSTAFMAYCPFWLPLSDARPMAEQLLAHKAAGNGYYSTF